MEDLQVDHSVTVKGLHALSLGGKLSEGEQDYRESESTHLGGLTHFYSSVGSNAVINSYQASDGTVCAQISKLSVSLSITQLVVYVAANFPTDSCAYKAVMTHEMKHVEVARQFTMHYQSFINADYANFVRSMGVVRAPSQAVAEDAINARSKAFSEPYAQRLLNDLLEAERLVDDPREYKAVGDSCDGETRRIMTTAVQGD